MNAPLGDAVIYAPDKLNTLAPGVPIGGNTDAFVVANGRILAVAPLAELRDRFVGSEVVRLDGVVLPAFNDGHMHLPIAGQDVACVDASDGVKTVDDLRRKIEAEARAVGPGEWVRVIRYDNMKLAERHLINRDDLDAWSPENPLFLQEASYHWGVLNSRALAEMGIDEQTEPPDGGGHGRFDDGRLNGMLYEQSWQNLTLPSKSDRTRTLPMRSRASWRSGILKVQKSLHAMGMASTTDAITGPEEHGIYQDLLDSRELTLRVNCLVSYEKWHGLRDLGLHTGIGGDRLRIGGVKLIADGAVGGGTCALEEPYVGRGDDRGMMTLSDEQLYEYIRDVHGTGSVVGIHANGDRAVRKVLEAFRKVITESPAPRLRHRIEHCSVVNEPILAEMAELGIGVAPFSTYVFTHGEKFLEWYGPDRAERMFAHRSFLDHGIPLFGASDHPCGPVEPLLGIATCVSRRSSTGVAVGLSQRITIDEAIRMYTQGSAYGEGQEDRKGTLAPGYFADFTVLDQNPYDLAESPEDITGIGVLATYVDGVDVL